MLGNRVRARPGSRRARRLCLPSAPVRLVIRLQTSTCSQQWDSKILVSGHVPMYGPLDKILDPGLRATFTFFAHWSKDRRFADATPATCHTNYLSLHPFCQNKERRWGGWGGKAESGVSNGRRWCGAQGGEKEKGREETASNRMESKKGRKWRKWNWGEKVKAIKGGRVKEDGDRTIAV